MKKLCSIFLMLAMLFGIILPCCTLQAEAAPIEYYETTKDFQGLKMSIIGDSISTYEGVTNSKTYNPLYMSTTEATFGTYYGDSARSDYDQFSQVKRADTWWQQTIDTLGMELLVNNAWSGSYIVKDNARGNTTEYPAAGYKNRAVNLHNGSKKPDIIAVYLGTNDIGSASTVGSKANVDTDSERKALYTSVNNYATPTTSVQAYYIMISRMLATYPDAEIYCLTPTVAISMTDARQTSTDNFNNGVRYLVDYWQGLGKKVYLVDLDKNSGISNNAIVKDYYYANNVHPDVTGMDWITSCLISEIMEHSTKGTGTSTFHEVSYNLSQCYAKAGLPRRVAKGQSLQINLVPYTAGQKLNLIVTMKDANGNNVVIPGGGVRGNSVYIPEVTGPITVKASVTNDLNFQWIANSEAFASSTGVGFTYNRNTLVSGTYTGGSTSGTFTDIQYSLAQPVVLEYDRPWVLEYKGGGTYAGGIMLMNNTAESATSGNMYIHITQTNVLFGYRDSVGYNNSGISWETIASKMGSTAGTDYRTETHVFRFENVPNGTSNKIYLYVDGVKIGSMDAVKLIGASATNSAASNVNISGKDFTFNYLGSTNHPVRNCSMSYIKVWENGQDLNTANLNSYRWELSADKDAFVTLDNNQFAENELRMQAGSISNGTFTNTYFEIDKQIVLMHDQTWNLEWVSSGEWYDARNGGMLLCSTDGANDLNSFYLYRRSGSSFIAFGERKNSLHNNYGVGLSANGIDGTVRHKYNLVNEVTTDAAGAYSTNMVYLYVDDVKIGPMTSYYQGGTDTGTTSNWVVGKDFTFNYLGTESFTVGDCDLEYLQVTVPCIHNYQEVVTAPTCTGDGFTTHTCSKCGDSYTDSTVAATGHGWSKGTCTACGIVCDHPNHNTSVAACTVCGFIVGHNWNNGICSDCGATCSHPVHKQDGQCTQCDVVVEHNYVFDGKCACGLEEVKDYYLFGYINGANYACEEDYENLGQYLFVDGKLTVTFDCDSYVAVKTGDNNSWYMTNGWQGNAKSVTLYNTNTEITADKLYIPGGVEVELTLVDNGDDTFTLSYEILFCPHTSHDTAGNCTLCGEAVVHSYDSVVTAPTCTEGGYTTYTCSICGHSYTGDITSILGHNYSSVVTAPTCDASGYTTYTCDTCGHTYTGNTTSATGHSYTSSVTTSATCTTAGVKTLTCFACGDSYNESIPMLGHSYADGKCSVCGEADPDFAVDYYLVGWINGSDYGCEGDYENMGQYKFVDGILTATFESDSYVFIKTTNNLHWFMFESYCNTTSGTLYNTTTGTSEKMFVPGGVELVFTLVENEDGSLTLSYAVQEEPVVVPTLTLNYPTLAFEAEILYNAYFTVSDASSVVEFGMVTFSSRLVDGTIADAVDMIPGYATAG
ncbi:MAG: hypothetical protein IJB11_04355, partial [Oscillospiraceae bacterium]|nr:hypothetical protein [Oscillospiraceae bacterium]